MKTSLGRRCLSLLMTLVLCASLAPAAFAAGDKVEIRSMGDILRMDLTYGISVYLNGKMINDAHNISDGGSISWESSDPAVAKAEITQSGEFMIYPQEKGTASVTATYTADDGSTATDTYQFRVEYSLSVEVRGDKLKDGRLDVEIGKPATVTATVKDKRGGTILPGATVSWEGVGGDVKGTGVTDSNGECIITIPNITEAMLGKRIYVTASTQDLDTGNFNGSSFDLIGKVPSTPTVTVDLSPATLSLKVGGANGKLNAVVKEDGKEVTGRTITWSGMGTVVDIDASGNVTPKQAGTVSIKASCGGVDSNVCTITVAPADTPPASAPVISSINPSSDSIIIEPGPNRGRDIRVAVIPGDTPVTWKSSDESVVSLTISNNVTATVTGHKPGKATITITVGDGTGTNQKKELKVEVSGIVVDTKTIELMENQRKDLPKPELYGNAKGYKFISSDPYTAQVIGETVVGYEIGKTEIIVTDSEGNYRQTIPVEVRADPSLTIDAGDIELGETLPFANLSRDLRDQLDGKVERITNLSVPTSQGTLYYRYSDEGEPGMGVGNETYYVRNIPTGQRDLMEVTFVPKPSFTGGKVEITYIAATTDGNTYTCRILVDVVSGGSNNEGVGNISLSTKYNTAVQFDGLEFDQICRERTGSNLDFVTFSLPPERQGTLYTDYAGEGNYGSIVTMRSQYSRKDLDDVWFVPAPGFEGTVTIYYTASSRGSTVRTYTGQIVIRVGSDSASSIGGLDYDVVHGGVAHFDDVDFNNYCHDILSSSQTLSYIRFDALPSSDQGVLYYDYRSSSNTGTRASVGANYYYGTRTPRIDRLTFAPADGFTGTVRIPFTGWTTNGTQFTGNVEINVRGGTGYGDIRYTCRPGQRKSFNDSDFNELCRDLTNSRLNYIQLQGLPNSSDGTLYYNSTSTRAATGTSYYNGSGSRRIDDLFFRANSRFSGSIDIEFTGYATSGETFHGTLTIESSGSDSSGGSSWGDISYTATTKDPAVFKRADFDDLSQWETDRDVSSVRFDIPSTSQGDLYRNYYSTSSKGNRITSSSTNVSASELNRVAFIPASGFTGTVPIDFTARATNGDTFNGTVEIEVERPGADVTVRYSTRVSPIRFRAEDFRRSGSTLSSIRFGSMPSASAGFLYYQYNSPTRYGRQASTSTSYRTSGSDLISDLTFIPRADFTGTVTLPFTGTNSNGSTFEGEVIVTVSPTYTSSRFSDLGSYSDQQRAAVDYLYENGITQGISSNQYGPEHSITRGDFAVMVYNAFGLSPMGSGRFTDVPSGVYYAQAVDTLSAMGIVSGIGGGAYGPNYTLTREDAVCMIQRAMRAIGWNASDGSSSYLYGYSDGSSVSGYAQGAMANAVQMGYLPTYGGRLDPQAPLTRIDMAQIVHRVLTY